MLVSVQPCLLADGLGNPLGLLLSLTSAYSPAVCQLNRLLGDSPDSTLRGVHPHCAADATAISAVWVLGSTACIPVYHCCQQ